MFRLFAMSFSQVAVCYRRTPPPPPCASAALFYKCLRNLAFWRSSWQIETFLGFCLNYWACCCGQLQKCKVLQTDSLFFSFMKGINIWNPLRAQHEIDHNWGHFKYKMEHSEEQPAVMKSSVTLTVSLVSASSPFSSFFFIFSLQLYICFFFFQYIVHLSGGKQSYFIIFYHE